MENMLTIQEAVDGFGEHITLKVAIKFFWVLSSRLAAPILTLFTNFAGFLPYKDWTCQPNSTTCLARVADHGISRDSFCGVNGEKALEPGRDIVWELDGRKTYAITWDLLCEREYLGTLLSSSYFVGSLVALLTCSTLYDKFGRLRVAQIAQLGTMVLTAMLAVPYDIWYFMAIRCLSGGFLFATITGYHVLTVEFLPTKWKGAGMTLVMSQWVGGNLSLVLMGYLFKDWRYIMLGAVVLLCTNLYPIFCLIPESPRFLLSNKRSEVASKDALKKLGTFIGAECDFDDVLLVENVTISEDKPSREMTFVEAMRDFIDHPKLLIQVAMLQFVWFSCGWMYYGFTFSWGTLGRNLYLSYLLATSGSVLVMIASYIYYQKLPRRALAYFDVVGAIALLMAITPDKIGFSAISVSQIACLLGSFITGPVFPGQFLWTQELSPTTHRGRILCLSSSSARIGSLLGPQASLLFTWHKPATLCIFAGVAMVSAVLMLLLPETKGKDMPSQASDVVSRREQVKAYRRVPDRKNTATEL